MNQGFPVFPLHVTQDKRSKRWTERPAIADWKTAASTDEATVRAWWEEHPTAIPARRLAETVVVRVEESAGEAMMTLIDAHAGDLYEAPSVLGPDGVCDIHVGALDDLDLRRLKLMPGVAIRADWAPLPGATWRELEARRKGRSGRSCNNAGLARRDCA
jgi:hypothetical protein